MKNIAVFCGSNKGTDETVVQSVQSLAQAMNDNHINLVYGGGKVGLMGIIADEILRLNGEVTGIIPHFLAEREIAHSGVTNLIVVEDMHVRKKQMSDMAEGFIMMPGGAGTLEEFFEVFTWAQLGLHEKPIAIYNINGFYNALYSMLKEMTEKGFLSIEHFNMVIIESNPSILIDKMKDFKPVTVKRYDK